MAATYYLLPTTNPKPFLHFHTNPPSIPSTNPTHVSFSNYPFTRRPSVRTNLKKKNPWLDPFDDGEDPNIEYGSFFSDGKQEEDPRPPDDPNSPSGFLKFPAGYSVEIASLGLKVRGDVRRCCCVISGGVYENLLFFPTIQLIKDRYPGVLIDVVASERGKQTYELNKNVRWANVFDPDDQLPEPAEYTEFLGVLKVGHHIFQIFCVMLFIFRTMGQKIDHTINNIKIQSYFPMPYFKQVLRGSILIKISNQGGGKQGLNRGFAVVTKT